MIWSSQAFLAPVSSRPTSSGPNCGLVSMAAGSSSSKRSLTRSNTVDMDSVPVVTKDYVNRQVPGEWFRDGSLLDNLAKEHAEAFSKLMRPSTSLTKAYPEYGPGPRVITWGSACTGSAGDVWVAKALEGVLPGTRIQQLFACESKPCKQKWIAAVHEAAEPASEICVFDDIVNLGGKMQLRYSQQQESPGLMQSPIRRRVRVLHFVQRHQPRARRAATFGAGSKKEQRWISTDLARHARLS